MASRIAQRRLSRSHISSQRSPITTPGAPRSEHATFNSPIRPFPALNTASPLHHILPPDSERAEPSTHVIRPPIDGVIQRGDLRFSRMSWNLVRVGSGTLVVCIVNTFLMEVQVHNHVHITQSMEDVINTASRLFPTQQPPNPGVYVIQSGSLENVSQLGETFNFPVVPVDGGTTRKTIQQTLNENRDKTIVFVYSGHFPQSLFEGLPGFERFPYTSEL